MEELGCTLPKTNIDPDVLAPWKSVFLYQSVVFRVHVSLPGCIHWEWKKFEEGGGGELCGFFRSGRDDLFEPERPPGALSLERVSLNRTSWGVVALPRRSPDLRYTPNYQQRLKDPIGYPIGSHGSPGDGSYYKVTSPFLVAMGSGVIHECPLQ